MLTRRSCRSRVRPSALRNNYRRLMLQSLERREVPAIINVTSAGDSGAGTLRQAILDAASGSFPGADTITIDPSVTTITLLSEITINDTTGDVTIIGNGAGVTTIQGGAFRAFNINSTAALTVTIEKLKINGFTSSANGGAILIADETLVANTVTFSNNKAANGGAISTASNGASITLNSSTITQNTATTFGGGIHVGAATATLTITTSALTSNSSGSSGLVSGGAIGTTTTLNATISNSTISNNATNGGGAGIAASAGTITITNSTFNANTAASNGGAFSTGTVTLNASGSAFTNNKANNGGVIRNSSTTASITFTDSVISGNSSTSRGAFYFVSSGSLKIERSSLFNNVGGSGAAIDVTSATVTLTNNTLAYNTATGTNGGGAINLSSAAATLSSDFNTIAYNRATGSGATGGGIRRAATTGGITLNNTVVANNTATAGGQDFNQTSGTATISGNNNWFGSVTAGNFIFGGSGNQNGDPLLDPALTTSFGGTTPYLYPLAGSPLRNAGDNSAPQPPTDQRGGSFNRLLGSAVDIGSIESEIASLAPTAKFTVMPDVTKAGGTPNTVEVVYSDTQGDLNLASLGLDDIEIRDPGANVIGPTAFVVDPGSTGSSATVTYTFSVPGGTWDILDNGKYSVSLLDGNVSDTAGNKIVAPSGPIGSFRVGVNGTVTVTTAADTVDPNDGVISLREALALTQPFVNGADTIAFSPAINGSTITLGSALVVNDAITITGNGPANTIISGGNLVQLLNFSSGIAGSSTVSGVTLTGGKVTGSGAAIAVGNNTITVENAVVSANSSSSTGGAIYVLAGGHLTVNDSLVSDNTGTTGGAIALQTTSTVTVNRSTLSGNTGTTGGAIYLTSGSLTVDRSTLSANVATGTTGGGAVSFSTGTVVINNSTLSGNTVTGSSTATTGGGVRGSSSGTLTVTSSTIVNNSANRGGGLGFSGTASTTVTNVTLENSIVAGNFAGDVADSDLFTAATSISLNTSGAGYNLIGKTPGVTFKVGGVSNLFDVDAKLADLGNYGGPTKTHAILAGSPAINAGSTTLTIDQRGVARPDGPAPDIGAYEGILKAPTGSATLTDVTTEGVTTYKAVVVYTDDGVINTGTIDLNDVVLNTPGIVNLAPTSKSILGSGGSVTVTYTFTIGGGFTTANNGPGTLTLLPNQVFDFDVPTPNAAIPGVIGNFTVAVPITYLVDAPGDVDDGITTPGNLTIREAIRLSNDNNKGVADVITFHPSLNGTTVTLASELSITDPVVIKGNGASLLTISGNSASRIFNFGIAGSGANSTISGLTLTGGAPATGNGGAILLADDNLTLANVVITGNKTVAGSTLGGAISVAGATLVITDSVLSNNSAVGNGGAIHNSISASVIQITRTTISGNTSGGIGGGIYSSIGKVTITDTTLSGNTAGSTSGGGGIGVSTANLTITNSTISGNSATNGASAVGGGLRVSSSATVNISNSTIARNTASGTGGGGISFASAAAVVNINSTLIAGNANATHPDLFSSVTTTLTINGGNNLVGVVSDSDIAFGGISVTGDPRFGPLANNGGPTQTHALTAISPGLELGANPLGLTFDQRGSGFPRSIGNTDIGAFEGLSTIPLAFGTSLPNVPPINPSYSFEITYTDNVGINVGTLDNFDVQVSGKAFPTPVFAEVISVSGPANAVVVTYSISPPPGGWDVLDNGDYTVTLVGTVTDGTNAVPTGPVGTFRVAVPGKLVVDNVADIDDGNYGPGELTLREAVNISNIAVNTVDTITFAPSINGKTITLLTGLTISEAVDIVGNGTTNTIISGGSTVRPFTINIPGAGQPVNISKLTITGGSASSGGGAIDMTDDALSLSTVTVTNSKGTTGGGVNLTTGTLTITDSVISNNSATTSGGGLRFTTGTVGITRSTLSGNTATTTGGGIYGSSTGTLNITASTLNNNVANSTTAGGGAIRIINATVTIVNSTLSGNAAAGNATGSIGGAIHGSSTATLKVYNSTITNNTAVGRGGGLGFSGTTLTTVTFLDLYSTIVAGNEAGMGTGPGPDMFTAATTVTFNVGGDNNLIGDLDAQPFTFFISNNQIGTVTTPGVIDPLLAPLGDYGGPTQTHAPFLGSPVLNKGLDFLGLTTDQRGVARPTNPALFDIGSVEGALVDPIGKLAAPLTNVSAPASSYTFSVVYSDEGSINTATITGAEIKVTGPGGVVIGPASVGGIAGSGGSVTVTYNLPAPGGSWDFLENGSYAVTIVTGKVFDQDVPTPNFVRDTNLGSFKVGLPGSIVVDITADEDDGIVTAGDVSLREAVRLASSVIGGAGTVTFAPALNGQTLGLTLGEIAIPGNVVITGPGSGLLTVNANSLSRIFNVDDGAIGAASVTISGLTLTQGKATGDGGAINVADENLTLTDVVLTNNSATVDGGAINVELDGAVVTLTNVTVSGNRAGTSGDSDGGGINFEAGGTFTITASSIIGNTAFDDGGGLLFQKTSSPRTVLIDRSTIANNVTTGGTGAYGGGINFGGSFDSLVIRNSTISGNVTTAQGGGIQFYAVNTPASIVNSTIANNTATGNGGGINLFTDATLKLLLESTIVSNNLSKAAGGGNDVRATTGLVEAKFTALGSTSIGVANFLDSGNNLFGQDLKLGVLGFNGGPTQTIALLPGSPAINAGSNPLGLTTDQRGSGFARAIGQTDIGAYEVDPSIPSASATAANVTLPDTLYTFTVTYTSSSGIKVSTVGAGTDITVTGPNGFSAPATFVTIDNNTDGSPRTATYSFVPPGGVWDGLDNGFYTISVNANEVQDLAGKFVGAGPVGSFQVSVPVILTVDIVDDENDGNTGKGDLSLREAIGLANLSPGSLNLINFDPAVFGTPQTITLTLGQIDIAGNMTIAGPGANLLTLSGNNASRVFGISNPSQVLDVTISGLTIANGFTPTGQDGGAIQIATGESVTFNSVHIRNNTSSRYGGAIHATSSTITVNNSTLNNNKALSGDTTYGGGAILMQSINSVLTVRSSTLSNNEALAGVGGAINFYAASNSTLTVENSTLTANTAINAGAIRMFSAATSVLNSVSSIISGNKFTTGTQADIQLGSTPGNFSLTLLGSEVGITTKTYDSFTAANLGADAKLGPLQFNGGPTPTRALLPGSPAINNGFAPISLTTDQRGRPRNVGGVDIGAYEVNPAAKVTSVVINNGAAQRSRVTSLKVNFDSPVGLTTPATAFTLSRVSDSATVGLNAVLDPSGTFVTITFTGGAVDGPPANLSLADGRYTLTALAAQFNGDGLDGDGNGTGGDNYVLNSTPYGGPGNPATGIFRLFGDNNGNGQVGADDFLAFRLAFLSSNPGFDFDGNGTVDAGDFLRFRLNFLAQIV